MIQHEISQLSEEYSVKCLENASMEERLDMQTKALNEARKRNQDVNARSVQGHLVKINSITFVCDCCSCIGALLSSKYDPLIAATNPFTFIHNTNSHDKTRSEGNHRRNCSAPEK